MDSSPHPDDVVRPIIESMELAGSLDELLAKHERALRTDPEWATPKHVHCHDLVIAFAYGVLAADPWHHGYKVPPGFDSVLNWIAFKVQEEFKDEVVKLSLVEIRDRFKRWGAEHPQFLKWNEAPPGVVVGVVSRYSAIPNERQFIGLDAIVHNAILYIRDKRRKDEAFDLAFDKKYGHLNKERGDESGCSETSRPCNP
jgi:hypothetical protein